MGEAITRHSLRPLNFFEGDDERKIRAFPAAEMRSRVPVMASNVGWAKARQRRAHHRSATEIVMVGTLRPSLVELPRARSLCPPCALEERRKE